MAKRQRRNAGTRGSRSALSLSRISAAAEQVEAALLKRAAAQGTGVDTDLRTTLRFIGTVRDLVELFCRAAACDGERDFVLHKPRPRHPRKQVG